MRFKPLPCGAKSDIYQRVFKASAVDLIAGFRLATENTFSFPCLQRFCRKEFGQRRLFEIGEALISISFSTENTEPYKCVLVQQLLTYFLLLSVKMKRMDFFSLDIRSRERVYLKSIIEINVSKLKKFCMQFLCS